LLQQEQQQLTSSATLFQLQTLASLYHDDFDALQVSGRVRITFANTYQRRITDSTKGCAVLAPLLCIHHLLNDDNNNNNNSAGGGIKKGHFEDTTQKLFAVLV
jgi:hypothetical protein